METSPGWWKSSAASAPASADTFTVKVRTTAITEGVPAGLGFGEDGKRLLLTNRAAAIPSRPRRK